MAQSKLETLNGYMNWMGATPGLMEKPLSEIMMPGVHHTLSATLGLEWSACTVSSVGAGAIEAASVFAWAGIAASEYAKNHGIAQRLTPYEQLSLGARYLDMRNCYDQTAGEWRTHHTVYGAPSRKLLQELRRFLEESRHELILLEVNYSKDQTPIGYPDDTSLINLVREYLAPYLYHRQGAPAATINDLRLGDVVADGPKVIALYNNGDFTNTWTASDHPDFWPFSGNVCDFYDGKQSVGDLNSFLAGKLSTADPKAFNKLQYILEWIFVNLDLFTSSLETFESDLPAGLRSFWEAEAAAMDRANVILVDFYEKNADYIMEKVVQHNTGSLGLLRGFAVPGTNGYIATGEEYRIVSLDSDDNGRPFVLDVLAGSVGNIDTPLSAQPYSDTVRSQRFKVVDLPSGDGIGLFNGYFQKYIAKVGNTPYPLGGADAYQLEHNSEYRSALTFGWHAGEGPVFSIRMRENDGENFDVQGDGGVRNLNDGNYIGLYGGQENKQKWMFVPVRDRLTLPWSNRDNPVKQDTTYQLICQTGELDNAITVNGTDHSNYTVMLERASEENTRQYWTVVIDNGVLLYNPFSKFFLCAPKGAQTNQQLSMHFDRKVKGKRTLWKIFGHGNGNAVHAADHHNISIDAKGGRGEAGDSLILFEWSGHTNQTFAFREVDLIKRRYIT